jgi:integrase
MKLTAQTDSGRRKAVATATCGNVSIPIFSGTNRVAGRHYQQFLFTYRLGDLRVRRRFADLEAARKEARLVAEKLHHQQGQVLQLKSADRDNYIEAQALLKPFGLRLGNAIGQLVEALRLLPKRTTLIEAVRDFANRANSVREQRLVSEVVTEFLARKEKDGVSEAHLRPLTLRLNRFAQAFQMPIAQLTSDKLQAWLDSMDAAPRTKHNEIRNVGSLVRFAVNRKYAPADVLVELAAVGKVLIKPGKTEIFTPEELAELFSVAPAPLVPWLAIGAFCGLRTAEILRLEWQDVNLGRRSLTVDAKNAKTGSRRIVPLCDAAIEWLRPCAKTQGPVAPFIRDNWLSEALTGLVNKARKKQNNKSKFAWVRNGLRHSFASYRLEIVKNVDQVALEAGNSARMIFTHYRELTTEEKAKAWFNVRPTPVAANVIPLAV